MRSVNRDSVQFRVQWARYRSQLKTAYRLFEAGRGTADVARITGVSYDRAKTWHEEFRTGKLICRIAKGAATARMLNDPMIRSYRLYREGFAVEVISGLCGYPVSDIKRFITNVEEMIERAFNDEF